MWIPRPFPWRFQFLNLGILSDFFVLGNASGWEQPLNTRFLRGCVCCRPPPWKLFISLHRSGTRTRPACRRVIQGWPGRCYEAAHSSLSPPSCLALLPIQLHFLCPGSSSLVFSMCFPAFQTPIISFLFLDKCANQLAKSALADKV